MPQLSIPFANRP